MGTCPIIRTHPFIIHILLWAVHIAMGCTFPNYQDTSFYLTHAIMDTFPIIRAHPFIK